MAYGLLRHDVPRKDEHHKERGINPKKTKLH